MCVDVPVTAQKAVWDGCRSRLLVQFLTGFWCGFRSGLPLWASSLGFWSGLSFSWLGLIRAWTRALIFLIRRP